MVSERVFNFSAGPAALPIDILIKAKEELLNWHNSGMSVMEMSHRSKEFGNILDGAEAGLRRELDIPSDYEVLFLHGGASLQFAMIPLNLCEKGKSVDVIHTGSWTKKALSEIKKVGECRVVYSGEKDNYLKLPVLEELSFNPEASYVHMASNNTIFGTQFKEFPDSREVPLVCDMSSDILSRSIDVSRFGIIFAGAQKNLGPSGLGIVIIRKELSERVEDSVLTMLQYRAHIKNKSLYNTPPTFAIYMVGLMMDWLRDQGGVLALEQKNLEKATHLYKCIDESPFYYSPIPVKDRSPMNVIFRIQGDRVELEKKFSQEATQEGLCNLKGHRSVGGLRASIYNASDIKMVKALGEFMRKFEKENG